VGEELYLLRASCSEDRWPLVGALLHEIAVSLDLSSVVPEERGFIGG
jgi:hypothetical protein